MLKYIIKNILKYSKSKENSQKKASPERDALI